MQYKNIKLQDVKLSFSNLNNVKVYISSYFKINDDRPAKSQYFLDSTETSSLESQSITIEMYNKTFIYIVPEDPTLPSDASFTFNVFQAQAFLYDDKYTGITLYISGIGSIMLVFSVIIYLDGFTVFYKFVKEYIEDRKRKQELQA